MDPDFGLKGQHEFTAFHVLNFRQFWCLLSRRGGKRYFCWRIRERDKLQISPLCLSYLSTDQYKTISWVYSTKLNYRAIDWSGKYLNMQKKSRRQWGRGRTKLPWQGGGPTIVQVKYFCNSVSVQFLKTASHVLCKLEWRQLADKVFWQFCQVFV